ncbi:hypothetical protein QR98_0098690 [Sarcoptes scabiei]|uniref:Uncharacterized protein n=1 Tax=Sarcoptes scabiei TaxID=52283 RepID=A0A132AKE1_SARSC|nr:hypothetical protein QR98_0098690 [Sarcoptes scabiei]
MLIFIEIFGDTDLNHLCFGRNRLTILVIGEINQLTILLLSIDIVIDILVIKLSENAMFHHRHTNHFEDIKILI